MTPPTEFASMSDSELIQMDIDFNGVIPRAAQAELRRRQLAARTGGGRRNPAELLRELERRKNGPDLRTPAERLIWLEARKHVTASGVDPRELLLQMAARRISQGW
jgi:hypothetical protein